MRGHVVAASSLSFLILGLLAVADHAFIPTARALPPAAPASTPDDDEEDERPKGPRLAPGKELGLALTLSRGEVRDTRAARLVALDVPEGTPPSPFLAPGPFRATWEGDLGIPFRGEYTFAASGRGTIRVEVNGKVALEGSGDDLGKIQGKPAKLRKGANKLVVTYDAPTAGDAAVRLAWSSEDFAREPIGPVSLARDLAIPALLEGTKLREGRALLADLRCLHCHAPTAPIEGPGRMPELATDAPSLADVGARLKADWVARWVADPKAFRANATMPRVLHGPDAADQGRDIAAYLATLGQPEGSAAPGPGSVEAGGRLFANLGCVGCHTLPDRDDTADDARRVPLRFVGAKWRPQALVAFLERPDRHYAWIKMPNFHLTADEAAKLAAYVASPPAQDMGDPPPGKADPERGKSLLASSGCVNCHTLPSISTTAKGPAFASIPPEGLSRGCLAPADAPDRKAPDFHLGEGQVRALQAIAKVGLDSLTRDAEPECAERQVKSLRCNACHKRDGHDDAWTDLKVETDKLLAGAPLDERDPDGLPYPADQVRPSLTWTGEKLRPEWSSAFIAGRVPYKPRPYLRARMPAFAVRADGLARGLALEHGFPSTSPPDAESDPDLLPEAMQLVKNSGLNCVSCHNIGKVAAVGVFEAPGINFRHVKERIRPDYFARWVRAPIRVEPDTKMPTYFNGEASVQPAILGGKADAQIDALWNYLLQGDAIEPPGN